MPLGVEIIGTKMRWKQSARKTICGGKPSNYQTIVDLQQRQRSAAEFDVQQMTAEANTDLGDHNDGMRKNHVEMTNLVKPLEETLDTMPLIHFAPSNKNNIAITAAVGLNDPARFKKLPTIKNVQIVTQASLETKKTSTEQVANCTSTSGEHQWTEPNEIDDFILQESSSLEKAISTEASSTRVINKTCSKKRIQKRSAGSSSQNVPTKKRTKRSEKNLCKKFLDNLNDPSVFLNVVTEKIDLENILEVYKKNKTEEDIENVAVRVLGLETKKNTTNPEMIPTLMNFLEMISKLLVDEPFEDIVLNVIKDKLKATKLLEVLNEEEVKLAVIEKFTPTGMLDILWQKHRSTISEKILEKLSVNEIIDQVRSRNDLNTSETLLKLMLQSFSQIVPEEPNSNNEINVKSEFDTFLLKILTNITRSRTYLKSSENLLQLMLRNIPENFSNETKQSIKNVLLQKFSRQDIADLFKEVLIPKERSVIVID